MKTAIMNSILAILLALISPLVQAQSVQAQSEKKPVPDRLKEEVAQHRRLAEVHENAARCLESGKSEKECHAQLEKACKGVGIGKYCGMRHTH